jgi:radical SAM superfamily enzyme YgiQ (UPF0313 family)
MHLVRWSEALPSRPHVLLVNPWIYDFAAFNLWCEPLGLLSIGAVLRRAAFRIELLDCLGGAAVKARTDGRGKFYKTHIPKPGALLSVPRRYGRYGMAMPEFLGRLSRMDRPDLVLVTSSMTYWYPGVFEVIRRLSKRWPGVPLILGGTYASLCPEHACRWSGAGWVVEGEAEEAILELVEHALAAPRVAGPGKGRPASRVRMEAGAPADLDALPMPAHELRWQGRPPPGYIGIETSRGCLYRCTYCASHRLHPVFRRRSAGSVADEIGHYTRRHGIRHVVFFDDALLFRPERHLYPLVEEILRRGLRCVFHTPNGLHAAEVTREAARRMYRAGFQTVRLGLETADPGGQARTGGKITNEAFEAAVEALKEAGFTGREVAAYLLVGMPGQSPDEVLASIRFVHRCGIQVRLSEFSPIPGTPDGKTGGQEAEPAEDEPLLHNNSFFAASVLPEPWITIEKIKQRAREGNRRILKGLPAA